LDLRAFECELPRFYLNCAPEQFHELFQQMDLSEIRGAKGTKGFCRCLRCGQLLSAKRMTEPRRHSLSCSRLFVFITGRFATIVVDFNQISGVTTLGALYVTQDGDEDIGLEVGKFLFLSKDKKKQLLRGLILGQYDPLLL
jgi:hypothetical protein